MVESEWIKKTHIGTFHPTGKYGKKWQRFVYLLLRILSEDNAQVDNVYNFESNLF